MSPPLNVPYKRSVITDEISQDLFKAISMAKEFGLQGLEIRTVWEKGPHQLTPEDLKTLKSQAEAADLEIPCLAPPFLKANADEWPQHKEILANTIRAAEALGARIIRGFTFWKGQATFDRIVDAYREVVPMLERAGMTVAIENEPSCVVGTTERIPELLAAIGSDNVKALWDPANATHDGEIAYPNGYDRVIAHIAHVHLKDGRHVDGKWQHAIVGEGTVGLVDVSRALAKGNYSAWVSLETHYRPARTNADLTRPGGSALSELGEEGTRLCLEGWAKVLEAAARSPTP